MAHRHTSAHLGNDVLDEDSLKTIVAKWVAELSGFEGVSMVTVPGTVGGGSLPGEQYPSWALRLHGYPVEQLKQRLLKCRPAVYGVVKDNAYLIDARTVVPLRQEKALLAALKEVLKSFKATR